MSLSIFFLIFLKIFFYLSHFSTHAFFFLSLLPLLFQIWLYERFRLLYPPTVPPSQYLHTYYRDHRPKHAEMSFDEFTKFMKHTDVTDIQGVVEW